VSTRGGIFTDIVAGSKEGSDQIVGLKVPSTPTDPYIAFHEGLIINENLDMIKRDYLIV
jgi:N-methylhydantoinase A/oxoprolinase/acetone carboxylase beta subunit